MQANRIPGLLLFILTIFSWPNSARALRSYQDPLYENDGSDNERVENYPESCECVESGVTKANCRLFRCKCVCDLTADLCDYNCCCDEDCSTSQVDRWKDLDVCLFEGRSKSIMEECYSSTELYGVNPRDPLGGQSSAQIGVGQALCIEQRNTAIQEDFYIDSNTVSDSTFDSSEGEKDYSYIQTVPDQGTVDDIYDENDTIPAFLVANGDLVSNGPGYLQIPIADVSGRCNDQNYARFEVNEELQFCSRELSSEVALFSAQCEGQFSVSRFVSDLWLAQEASSIAADGGVGRSKSKNVGIDDLYFEDFYTGELQDIESKWKDNDCETAAFAAAGDDDDSSLYSTFPTLRSALGQSDINSTAGIKSCSYNSNSTLDAFASTQALCRGFIKSVNYIVEHKTDENAEISSVSAQVTVSDVPISLIDSTATSVTVSQCFSVEYFSGGKPNNARPRSGNPGYLMGLPIRFGFKNKNIIETEQVGGFTVNTPLAQYNPDRPDDFGRGYCPRSESSIGTQPVRFGYDIATGCTMNFNRSELIAFCCTGASSGCPSNQGDFLSPYSQSSGLPYFFGFTKGYVALYGNADFEDLNQWLRLNEDRAEDTRSWDDDSSTCSNMWTALNIEFLIAFTGPRDDPQNKIIGARAQVATSDIIMTVPPTDELSTMTVPLSVTVSFVFREENKIEGYSPPAPPVLFEVPYDVFYPFESGGGKGDPNSAPTSSYIPLMLSLICSTVLLGWNIL